MIINVIQIYYEEDKKNIDYTFKLLIPSNYVTKLIGQSKVMIYSRGLYDKGHNIKIRGSSNKDYVR